MAFGKQESPLLELNVDNAVATSGFYRLSWELRSGSSEQPLLFVLQESPRADFSSPVTLYKGPDLATVVSGKSDGVLYYRVDALTYDGAKLAGSNPVSVEIQHHPLSRALLFFGMGALVFLLTLLVILKGKAPEISR